MKGVHLTKYVKLPTSQVKTYLNRGFERNNVGTFKTGERNELKCFLSLILSPDLHHS